MFDVKNLSVSAYGNGFTLWHYRTDENADQVLDSNYFETADLLTPGDMIFISANDNGAIRYVVAGLNGPALRALV